MDPDQCIAVLAAGLSSRFGGEKLVQDLCGKPVLAYIIDKLERIEGVRKILVIKSSLKIPFSMPADFMIIENKHPEMGLSFSIKTALDRFGKECEGFMFLLADQPFLKTDTINAMLALGRENPGKIVAASVEGEIRNPMLFPRRFYESLMGINGDHGAKSIAVMNSNDVIRYEVNEEETIDIDTKKDLEKAVKILRNKK